MEDLIKMLDTLTAETIQRNVKQFIHSADDYPDKLKLALVIMDMLKEGSDLLNSLDRKDFISKIQKEAEEKIKQTSKLYNELITLIQQNEKVAGTLSKSSNSDMEKEQEIRKLLENHRIILKKWVEEQNKRTIQKQMEHEPNVRSQR